MTRLTCFLLIFMSFVLASCSADRQAVVEPLTPMPVENAFNDPNNEIFMSAVEEYITDLRAPAQTQYEFTRIDLDNDGRREGIVIMKTPHQYWCDMNGCRMAVFKATNEQFMLISEIAPVRGPMIVSKDLTNGWRDLVVRISGQADWDAREVPLQFDGRSYPSRPVLRNDLIASNELEGVMIFP